VTRTVIDCPDWHVGETVYGTMDEHGQFVPGPPPAEDEPTDRCRVVEIGPDYITVEAE